MVRFLDTLEWPGDQVVEEAKKWLGLQSLSRMARSGIHLDQPHDPYELPEPDATRYAGRLYDGEVAWSDELVGQILQWLERSGLDDTLVVATSDHGESLGEHGEAGHGFFAYEATLRVPLLVRGPGIAAERRIEGLLGHVDLFPTILDLLGVPLPAGLRVAGRNLAPVFRDTDKLTPAATYGESLLPLLHYGWSDLRTLRDGRWKYILAPRPELYQICETTRVRPTTWHPHSRRARPLCGRHSRPCCATSVQLARVTRRRRAFPRIFWKSSARSAT